MALAYPTTCWVAIGSPVAVFEKLIDQTVRSSPRCSSTGRLRQSAVSPSWISSYSSQSGVGSQPTTSILIHPVASQPPASFKHLRRSQAMRLTAWAHPCRQCTLPLAGVGLDEIKIASVHPAARHGVDQDHRPRKPSSNAAYKQDLRPRMPKVDHTAPDNGNVHCDSCSTTSTPKASSPRKILPTPAIKNARLAEMASSTVAAVHAPSSLLDRTLEARPLARSEKKRWPICRA